MTSFEMLTPILTESVSNVTSTNSVDLGTIRLTKGEEYVYVYNDGGVQISQGYFAVPQSGSSGYSVTVSSVTGYDIAMGFCKHATIATAQYGWLMTKGFTTVINGMASTALVSGDVIIPASSGQVQVAYVATGSAAVILGKMISATGSAGTGGKAFVRCFGS